MNLNVFCRIVSYNKTDSWIKITDEPNKTVIKYSDDTHLKVSKCFTEFDNNPTIYDSCVESLVNATIDGYNSAFIVFGEPEYDKSYIVNGTNTNNGLFSLAIHDLFNKLKTNRNMKSSFKVQLCIFYVVENVIIDLAKLNNSSTIAFDKVRYSENEGIVIEGLSKIDLDSAETAVSLFSNIWNSKDSSFKSTGTIILQIKCNIKTFEKEQNNILSRFSIVYFPEENQPLKSPIQLNREQNLNGLLNLQILLEKLNETNHPLDNQGKFILNTFLEDEIGGNCITNVLLCLPAQLPAETVKPKIEIMNILAKIQNFPIVNTENARRLINKFHCDKIRFGSEKNSNNSDKILFSSTSQSFLVENINLTKNENIKLRDKVEDLQAMLMKSNSDSINFRKTNSENHDMFIKQEEEKLRSSKLIMDLEIKNSKLKEQVETVRFELLNKILHFEEKLTACEVEKECYKVHYKELETVKEEKLDLAVKLSTLQKAFDILQNQAHLMESKNTELNLEFINLSNNQSNIDGNSKRMSLQPVSNISVLQGNRDLKICSPHQELKILSPISPSKDRNLKLRLGQLQEELQNARTIAQERLKTLSQSSIDLIVIKDENKKLESQINYLNKYLSQIAQDYQKQLKHYSNIILNFMNSNDTGNKNYKNEIETLLNQYDSNYAAKVNQMTTSIKNLTNRLNSLRLWSDRAIIEYILIRDQIIEKQINSVNLGPDPKDILMNHPEPTETIKLLGDYFNKQNSHKTDSSNIMELRQKIREFGNTTVTDLEIERAQLISRNVELEQELLAAQEYIDYNLKKKLSSKIPRNKNI